MFFKEPQEIQTFGINWADWLGALTITASSWTAPAGITVDSDDFTSTVTTVTLSGGTWAETYELSNTITASDGSVETRTIIVRIQRSVAYCSSTEVRRRLMIDTTSTTTLPAAELEALIEQASRYIDTQCGVPAGTFNPSPIPIAEQRTFYGDGTHYLRLDAFIADSITAVTLPDEYTAIEDYVPRGDYLVRATTSGALPAGTWNRTWWPTIGGWPEGVPVTVTAIWGYLETPPDIKMATIEMAINLFRETDPATLSLLDLERQPLRERLPPRVAEVIRRYRAKAHPAFV